MKLKSPGKQPPEAGFSTCFPFNRVQKNDLSSLHRPDPSFYSFSLFILVLENDIILGQHLTRL